MLLFNFHPYCTWTVSVTMGKAPSDYVALFELIAIGGVNTVEMASIASTRALHTGSNRLIQSRTLLLGADIIG